MTTPLAGAFPVLPTPFRPDGSIDERDFKAIVKFALDSGVDGVVYPGVASEVDTLSEEERHRQVDLLAVEIGGEIPLIHWGGGPHPPPPAPANPHAPPPRAGPPGEGPRDLCQFLPDQN